MTAQTDNTVRYFRLVFCTSVYCNDNFNPLLCRRRQQVPT